MIVDGHHVGDHVALNGAARRDAGQTIGCREQSEGSRRNRRRPVEIDDPMRSVHIFRHLDLPDAFNRCSAKRVHGGDQPFQGLARRR